MNENLNIKTKKVIMMIEEFIKMAKSMLDTGKISEDEYNQMLEKKIDFLNKYNSGKIINFSATQNKKAI